MENGKKAGNAKIDIIGQHFGLWTVLRRDEQKHPGGTYYICRCDCGTERAVVKHALLSGASWHCGCQSTEVRKRANEKKAEKRLNGEYKKKPINLVGQRFGRLVVLEQLSPGFATKSDFRCRCDCGNEVIKSYELLRAGVQSCGCLNREKIIDLKGRKFGMLTALEYIDPENVESVVPANQRKKSGAGSYHGLWKCQCDCGNTRYVQGGKLLDGSTKSCGCANRREDLTGQTFGRLTVLEEVPKGDEFYNQFKKTTSGYWKCQCGCGNITYASNPMLKRGLKISCGCYASDKAKKTMIVAHTKRTVVEGTDVDRIKGTLEGKLSRNNRTGITGVYEYHGSYRAQIRFKRKNFYLGQFKDKEEAGKARKRAEQILYGEFLDRYERELKAEFEAESDQKKVEAMRKLRDYCRDEHKGTPSPFLEK